MKKTIFGLFSVCLIAVSCGKDDPAPTPPANQSYANSNVGTTWRYERKTQDPTTLDTITTQDTTYVISGDTSINGKTYYRVEHKTDGSHDYYNHTSSDYYQFQNIALPPAIDTSMDILYLKEGATSPWTQNLTVNVDIGGGIIVPVTLTFSSSITNANTSITVLGTTYNEVVEVTTTVSNNAGLPMTSGIKNYYAKNIGLVKGNYDIEITGFGGVHNQTELKNADLR